MTSPSMAMPMIGFMPALRSGPPSRAG
jgi:hypothetical protein